MQPIPIRARLGGLTLSNVWATAVVTVSIGVTFMFRMSSIDLAYHVRAGEAILATHGAPSIDTFTFSMVGRPWLDQQWGAQVLLALVYRAGGWAAMGFFHARARGRHVLVPLARLPTRGASSRLSAALTLGGFAVCFYNAGMRPQTMAYPLFTGTLWILADRRAHPRRLWAPPVRDGRLGERARELPARPRPDRALVGSRIAVTRGDEELDAPVGALGLVATVVGPYGSAVWRYAIGIRPTNGSSDTSKSGRRRPSARSTARSSSSRRLRSSHSLRVGERRPMCSRCVWLGSFFLLGLSTARGEVWWGFVFPVIWRDSSSKVPSQRPQEARRKTGVW